MIFWLYLCRAINEALLKWRAYGKYFIKRKLVSTGAFFLLTFHFNSKRNLFKYTWFNYLSHINNKQVYIIYKQICLIWNGKINRKANKLIEYYINFFLHYFSYEKTYLYFFCKVDNEFRLLQKNISNFFYEHLIIIKI